ncbi:MAG: RHS repeat-associated core domain-containing protein [Ruminococcaceae bacterium]|nr:RHS repeat-associated core domain-containing protein [Oscillospiraceae bacterium]
MQFLRLKRVAASALVFLLMMSAVSCEYIDIKTVTQTEGTETLAPSTTQVSVGTQTELLENGFKVDTVTDSEGRVTEEQGGIYKNGIVEKVVYKKLYSYTKEGYIEGLSYENNDSYKCTYNKDGKIVSCSKNGSILAEYEYSKEGYLIREDNAELQCSYEYSYDGNGNIIGKKVYSYKDGNTPLDEKTFTYESGRLITSHGGKNEYNTLGNPTVYNNKGRYTFFWNDGGRLLGSVVTSEGVEIGYEYMAHGQRGVKSVNGVRYEYTWSKMKLTELKIIEKDNKETVLSFVYNESGDPVMFTCNGESYYYKLNVFKDVEEIFTDKGTVGRYYYNAWGEPLGTDGDIEIMSKNPIRYRGYIYDSETGMYYLHTRYYDPSVCRRVNADGYSSNNKEAYIYAKNDPVRNIDSTMTVKYPICNELHLYTEREKAVEGKINVIFKPYGANPVFQIENSYKIIDANQQRAVLEYIMASDLYSQEVYCRTIESMLVEWKAHNHIFSASPNERCRHVDFDKNDEGVSYSDFWKRAAKEYGI